ncbi:MAG: electron transport complex subunit E [Lachnospiraceae bacterium]|nr:electron transport complex subunit E [Lachnospiraceae bacterium]
MPAALERLYNGLIKENPTFVLTLGMCPTLAVTTSAMNGLGMGLTTMVVLALSNAFISLLRKVIPDKVRIPAFIVIIASFVTVMELLLEGYLPSLYDALGIYIPLIVVNCIILGRAESYASKNPVIPSFFDGVGMGLGFTFALTCIGLVRELLGSGKIFGATVMPESFEPISIFIMAPGAFFVLAALTAVQNVIKERGEKQGRDMSKIGSGCPGGCNSCNIEGCLSRGAVAEETGKTEVKKATVKPAETKQSKATENEEKGEENA